METTAEPLAEMESSIEDPLDGAMADSDRAAKPDGPAVAGGSSTERIRDLAYRFWEERGRPEGSPELDWYRAEQELQGISS